MYTLVSWGLLQKISGLTDKVDLLEILLNLVVRKTHVVIV